METKVSTQTLNSVKARLGFDNLFVINPLGCKSSLAMLWKLDQGIEVLNYSSNHIHLKIRKQNLESLWFLTEFYGHPKTIREKKLGHNCLESIRSLEPLGVS